MGAAALQCVRENSFSDNCENLFSDNRETRFRIIQWNQLSEYPAAEGRSSFSQRFSAGKRGILIQVPEGRPSSRALTSALHQALSLEGFSPRVSPSSSCLAARHQMWRHQNMKKESKSQSYLQRLLQRVRRLFRRKPEPEDPYAYTMAPVRRPPHGRSGAAVAEIEAARGPSEL